MEWEFIEVSSKRVEEVQNGIYSFYLLRDLRDKFDLRGKDV